MKTIYDQNYIELIANLRRERNIQKISQSDLSLKLAKPQSYISKIECCDRRADVIELLNICLCLGIKLSQIVPEKYKEQI